jgi:hypothetical protein
LGDFDYYGVGLACAAGISAAEAARRLEAIPADDADVEAIMDDPWSDIDESLAIVGVTDVPGGCVISQPWGYMASAVTCQHLVVPLVLRPLLLPQLVDDQCYED